MMNWYRVIGALTVLAFAPGIAAADEGSVYVSVGGLYVLPVDSEMSDAEDDWEVTGTLPLDAGPGFAAQSGTVPPTACEPNSSSATARRHGTSGKTSDLR